MSGGHSLKMLLQKLQDLWAEWRAVQVSFALLTSGKGRQGVLWQPVQQITKVRRLQGGHMLIKHALSRGAA